METHADEACSAFNLQMKYSCQRWIDGGDLGARINLKVVGASVVERDRNDYLGALDEPEA
jgi:hypothetical protein